MAGSLKNKKFVRYIVLIVCFFLSGLGFAVAAVEADIKGGSNADHEQLAQRFRPYYKFSKEKFGAPEINRPCSWEWLVGHSELYKANKLIHSSVELQAKPSIILEQNGDVRVSQR